MRSPTGSGRAPGEACHCAAGDCGSSLYHPIYTVYGSILPHIGTRDGAHSRTDAHAQELAVAQHQRRDEPEGRQRRRHRRGALGHRRHFHRGGSVGAGGVMVTPDPPIRPECMASGIGSLQFVPQVEIVRWRHGLEKIRKTPARRR